MASRDDAAYVEFVAATQDRLRRTAFLMTGNWATAADITQEALVRLYVSWPKLERGGGLASYARQAVVSAAIDHHRRSSRRPQEAEAVADIAVVADGSDERAERDALMTALRRIPPRQRACIVLRYFEDLSVAETARAMHCSEGNVKSQTAHGLAALKREYEALGCVVPELGGVA